MMIGSTKQQRISLKSVTLPSQNCHQRVNLRNQPRLAFRKFHWIKRLLKILKTKSMILILENLGFKLRSSFLRVVKSKLRNHLLKAKVLQLVLRM